MSNQTVSVLKPSRQARPLAPERALPYLIASTAGESRAAHSRTRRFE